MTLYLPDAIWQNFYETSINKSNRGFLFLSRRILIWMTSSIIQSESGAKFFNYTCKREIMTVTLFITCSNNQFKKIYIKRIIPLRLDSPKFSGRNAYPYWRKYICGNSRKIILWWAPGPAINIQSLQIKILQFFL